VTPAIAAVVAMYGAFMVVGWVASRKVREGTAADLTARWDEPRPLRDPVALPEREGLHTPEREGFSRACEA
jgi:hypothetical protein